MKKQTIIYIILLITTSYTSGYFVSKYNNFDDDLCMTRAEKNNIDKYIDTLDLKSKNN